VIPFQYAKKDAIASFEKFFAGKKLLPKEFKDENRIKEIKGVYIPFWLFGADAHASFTYRATRISNWSDGDFEYTKTDFYALIRSGQIGYANIPVDGSSKAEDNYMQSILPYDFSQLKPFEMPYLSGFFADRYDVGSEDCKPIANEYIRRSVADVFDQTATGYSSVMTERSSIQLSDGKVEYALLPVWLLTIQYNEDVYLYAMNGQTGLFVGNLPVSKKRYSAWLFGVSAAAFAVLSVIGWMFFG